MLCMQNPAVAVSSGVLYILLYKTALYNFYAASVVTETSLHKA